MQIKFRVWDGVLEIYVDTKIRRMFIDTNGILFLEVIQNRITLPRDPDNYIIEQWIGKKDKDDKDIYEGDRVEINDNARNKWNEEIYDLNTFLQLDIPAKRCKIIGNIHETSKQTSNKE